MQYKCATYVSLFSQKYRILFSFSNREPVLRKDERSNKEALPARKYHKDKYTVDWCIDSLKEGPTPGKRLN